MRLQRTTGTCLGIVLLGICLMATGAAWAQGDGFTIDFETYPGPDGMFGTPDDEPAPDCPGDGPFQICGPLGNPFESAGVTFGPVLLFQGPHFPDAPDDNHLLSSDPLDATFTFDVYEVSLRSYSIWPAALYAFDGEGNIIATDVLPNESGTFELGVMSISSDQAIRRVVALPEACPLDGGLCNEILNLDDLTLSTVPPATEVISVPVMSEFAAVLLMLLIGFSGFRLLSRTRSS